MSGRGLDIGYRGEHGDENIIPVLPDAVGVDLDYPGYDGVRLPFPDHSQDYVFASHILEHIQTKNVSSVIQDWARVVRPGGHIIIAVPHRDLYEKQRHLPSRWNLGHHRLYTAGSLLWEVETALPDVHAYRVRECYDNDKDFNYSTPPEKHSSGCYEVVCVLEIEPKIIWEGAR